jgi:hypothetical protein
MNVLVPLDATRRPNPDKTVSHTMYRRCDGTAESAVLFVNFDFRLSALKPNPRRFPGDHMVTTGKKIVVILRNPGKSEAVDLEEFWNVK